MVTNFLGKNNGSLLRVHLVAGLFLLALGLVLPAAGQAKTVTADVVVVDHALVFNRLGAQNQNGMIYALARDVIQENGFWKLRPDKRPRPLVLRVSAGDTLVVNFTNRLLDANPGPPLPEVANPNLLGPNNQVVGRQAGFHIQGLQLVGGMASDASNVGNNTSSLVGPGSSTTYTYFAEAEGTFLVTSYGATFGGEATGGNVGVGAFAAVNVEPAGALYYRSQVTEEELRLAMDSNPRDGVITEGVEQTSDGHPILSWGVADKGYEAKYPNDCAGQVDAPAGGGDGVWCQEGKAGLPILSMLHTGNNIVHSDLNAIITGTNANGSFPITTYPGYNPVLPNRLEPFREHTAVFHDEQAGQQAFPGWFTGITGHVTHGVRDSFMINYGSGGIGSEIIANRLGVGPMHDCLDCAYEEFFLTSFAVGDPAMLVDVPANVGLEEASATVAAADAALGPKATRAFYPADPSNVFHSYTGDFAKIRNLHAGPKEQHIFHLHNHQWLFNPNDDNSNYIDAQGIGPGSGYTYEINQGGSGNRNKTAGDAIYHCHFYPHFAQGMWYLWRVHDTMEIGTRLAVSDNLTGFHTAQWGLKDGTPAIGARALPDGEIVSGTPIPAVVPLPGKPMAPMPDARVTVKPNPNTTTASDFNPTPASADLNVEETGIQVPVGSLADLGGLRNADGSLKSDAKNPGFPFWVAGIEHIVGQRPTTPPLDMLTDNEAAALKANGPDGLPSTGDEALWQAPGFEANAGGWDGGLPRHALEGYAAGGASTDTQTTLDFTKFVDVAKPVYFPEAGTAIEKLAMAFHSKKYHATFLPDGTPFGDGVNSGFRTNGALPQPSAPYNEPCIDDKGNVFESSGDFFGGLPGSFYTASAQYGAANPRTYKGANLQFDAVFNKVGYHYPQQRIIALWEDVMPTINKTRPPEPLVMRLNTFDCTRYLHTNLVPEVFELDDYQVRTPTDIIGQHIHLPKWDLTTNDGAANGWNYEDGTLSPGTVRERIAAINFWGDLGGNSPVLTDVEGNNVANSAGDTIAVLTDNHLVALPPMVDGFPAHPDSAGARVTIQRWFVDPIINRQEVDRGLGIIFTHDHFGPSTHQQIGLYATVLAEPAGSVWKHNETGVALGTRLDGGPTSWQAIIEPGAAGGSGLPASAEPYREFYLEFSDFQHAYEAGVYIGAGPDGSPNEVEPDANSFRAAINPSFRQEAAPLLPDIVRFPPFCPNGAPRPCPEAISADDVGMLVVNYRNEPVGLRVFDPATNGPDGKPGTQTAGKGGDLAFALASGIPRAIPEMNVQPAAGTNINGTIFPPPINIGGVTAGDPFTPMMRGFAGDLLRVKIQSGATEHEHNATIHGVRWLQGGSSHGASPTSGWRNAQNDGISEQFTFTMPVTPVIGQAATTADYAYSVDASQDGWWSGMWGLMRSYNAPQSDLMPLNNGISVPLRIANPQDFNGACPADAAVRTYDLTAVLANDVLGQPLDDIGNPLVTIPENAAPLDNLGGPLDPDGGTLVYNPRDTTAAFNGPLHDPTSMLYVHTADLVPKDTDPATDGVQPDPGCFTDTGELDPKLPTCPVELAVGVPVEPIVLRAAAGECIDVQLRNKLLQPAQLADGRLVVDAGGELVFEDNGEDLFIEEVDPVTGSPILIPVAAADVVFDIVPDLAGYNTLLQMVFRDRNGLAGVTTFNNNLIRPSASVGLHAQLVEYDITKDDGVLVGTNPEGPELVRPGGTKTFRWYAGLIERQISARRVRLRAHPVEFGGTNLSPADKIKQGQKGLVGALIIEPQGATWSEDAGQRAAATVNPGSPGEFRDFAVIFQKGLNLRYSDGSPVENIAGEGGAIPEDSHDAGQKAINYGTEPAWFRFGLPADANFELDLAAVPNPEDLYSNSLAGNQDPATPVFTAEPGDEVRIRVLEPTGVGRGTTFDLHGHGWQRDPYKTGAVPSQTIENNPNGLYLGHQESVTPAAHFDIVLPSAGGTGGIGDYLYRDHGSFGNTDGLWGILRVAVQPVNTAPVVTIMSPADGKFFPVGDMVVFTAEATDAEDGDISGSIVWNSSIDGNFGTGASVTTAALSPGNHTITASAADSAGAPGSDSIAVTVTSDADAITVTSAVYRQRQNRWNVQGTGTVPGALITVTHDQTGAAVGSATVDAAGVWQINGSPEDSAAVAAAGDDTITAVSSGGGSVVTFPVTVRR